MLLLRQWFLNNNDGGSLSRFFSGDGHDGCFFFFSDDGSGGSFWFRLSSPSTVVPPCSHDESSEKTHVRRTKKPRISQESKPVFNVSDNKGKVVKIEENVKEEDLIRNIRLRTSPAPLSAVMTTLNPHQRQFVHDTGFGSLLGFRIDSLPGKLVYYVVDNFDSKSMVIRTINGDIKCDRQAVHDVFGVPMGTTDIFDLDDQVNDEFVEEWLAQWNVGKKVRASHIASKFNNNHEIGDFFKMNIIMLFVCTMVEADSNGYIKLDVLKRVSKDADLRSIDWCGYLLKVLKSSKDNWSRDFPDKNPYAGPATFLSLLYVDRTKCENVPVCRDRPIFKNWSGLLQARERVECFIGSFGMLEMMPPYEDQKEADNGFFVDDVKERTVVKEEEAF